jgi:hypothetical protein
MPSGKSGANFFRTRIWNLFFKKLMIYRPTSETTTGWLNTLFHTNERTIDNYIAKRDFKIPGKYWLTPMTHIHTAKKRHIPEGAILTVRKDFRDPFIDVETDDPNQVFRLTYDEWASIGGHLDALKYS